MKKRTALKALGLFRRTTLKWIGKKWVRRARIGLIWLRIRTGDELL